MSTLHILAHCRSTFHYKYIILTSTFSPLAPCVLCSPCCKHRTQASAAQYNMLEDKETDSLPCQIYPECYYGAMATDEDMQASLDGSTAGSLVFSAKLTGRKAPRGCYGNRLIICREGLLAATATWGPIRQFPPDLQEIRLTLMRTWPRADFQYQFAYQGSLTWWTLIIQHQRILYVCAYIYAC